MAQGDIPTSRGGPLRRRQKRQLEHLAEESDRDITPGTGVAHVRVLEVQTAPEKPPPVDREESDRPADPLPEVRSGFHVRAVPIDQPFDE